MLGEFLKRGQAESESWDNLKITMSKKFLFFFLILLFGLPQAQLQHAGSALWQVGSLVQACDLLLQHVGSGSPTRD